MQALHEHIARLVASRLKQRRVVVWYDPRGEFEGFISELTSSTAAAAGLTKVQAGDVKASIARFDGSYFALRASVEAVTTGEAPEPLLIYVPAEEPDRTQSVLMELEKAGTGYKPQLKRVTREVLRAKLTDGVIDEMLKPEGLTYADLAELVRQTEGSGGSASILKTIFSQSSSNEGLLAAWLADANPDERLTAKGVVPELLALIRSRLGLDLEPLSSLADGRARAWRYVLVNEFRADLTGEPPTAIGRIAAPATSQQAETVGKVAVALREKHAETYVAMATAIEAELGLGTAPIDPANLGKIDTFPFEERRLLAHAAGLVAAGKYGEATAVVEARRRSFWAEDLLRHSQWQLCRLLAEAGDWLVRVDSEMGRTSRTVTAWLEAYARDGGWYGLDRAQRQLESWLANLDEPPEIESAVQAVRGRYEDLLRRQTETFTDLMKAANWTTSGVLHQTRVYPEVVSPAPKPVAYLLVDALRYEMGVELVERLGAVRDLTLRPAVVALPSITPVGMAALMPGAASSFAVVAHDGAVASRIDGVPLAGHADREKHLQRHVPDAVDLRLGDVLQMQLPKLKESLGAASLVVVRSQEIDALGEMDGSLIARQLMDTMVQNVARAVRKLAAAGLERFVVVADHGHQFAAKKDADMRVDAPGGQTVKIERRCWIGRGGVTPPGTVRVGASALGYASDLEFVFPRGMGVFPAGGGLRYHHGGCSLQEMVVPVLAFRLEAPAGTAAKSKSASIRVESVPETLRNRTFGVRLFYEPFLTDPQSRAVRVVLVAGDEEVGRVGMAVDADLDDRTGLLTLYQGKPASVGLLLSRDDVPAVRLVVQDPRSEAVLAESTKEIPVNLEIRS